VIGAGSFLKLTEVYVGEGYDGTLTIANGGVVRDRVGVVAPEGDGYVVIDGAGSRWENDSSLSFGSAIPTDSSITVTNAGELDWRGGFGLYDTLRLDGSALLGGNVIFDGGETVALAGEGDVTISQRIDITRNWLFSSRELASFSSASGVRLTLSGKIAGDSNSILYVGAGDVDVSGPNNNYGLTEIYSAKLEVGANHALGRGEIDFVGGAHPSEVLVDAGVTLANKIANFGADDAIDLAGLQYSASIQSHWKANAAGGGSLTLISNGFSAVLNFTDSLSALSFALSADGGAGTLVQRQV
jgi:T5SS/PEP-CTERM-associated repeat protein